VLGKMQAVPLRDIWPHEAHNFTPWLLNNSGLLGDVLGMDIEISNAEHPVGGYSLDLIGQDVATGDRLIIENQLEQSDHSHLGQLLTYASGTEAVNIVWVASNFRAEHRAALDWLNDRTDEKTRFFGIEISAVKINDSIPAPLMRLVAQPNDWNKKVKASTAGKSSALGGLYYDFWSLLLDELASSKPGWSAAKTPSTDNWRYLSSGISGIYFALSFSQKGLCSAIYFGNSSADINAALYAALEKEKSQIEQSISRELSWEPLDGKTASRVGEYYPGNISDTEAWPEFVEWFLKSQSDLRRVFSDRKSKLQDIRSSLKAEDK